MRIADATRQNRESASHLRLRRISLSPYLLPKLHVIPPLPGPDLRPPQSNEPGPLPIRGWPISTYTKQDSSARGRQAACGQHAYPPS